MQLIIDLKDLVSRSYEHLFYAVIVHGSVSTNDVVSYSDFDGLLIVKDEYKNSKNLKNFIIESLKIIKHFDPLQHHGWFIIYESSLSNYDTTFFPIELYKKSKLVYPFKDINIKINVRKKLDFYSPFDSLSASILKKIEQNNYPNNSFELKSFLKPNNAFALPLPQAKHKKVSTKRIALLLLK